MLIRGIVGEPADQTVAAVLARPLQRRSVAGHRGVIGVPAFRVLLSLLARVAKLRHS
jgi:hypothetical protein